MRYLYATFKVRNADANGNTYSTALQNLTFLAVDTDAGASIGETYNQTAFAVLKNFDGDEPANAATIAENIIPTGQVELNTSGVIESSGPDVLQVFTESEVQTFEDDLPVTTEVSDIFPYGFVVRSPRVTPNSRELPVPTSTDDFDGVVTFAFKVPLQAQANEAPFEITIMFLAVDDDVTRVTRSVQEARYGGQATFEARLAELGTTPTFLGYADYQGNTIDETAVTVQCGTRVAGPDGGTTTNLNGGLGCQNDFFLALNGVTVKCPAANVGDTGIINGVTYTKRTKHCRRRYHLHQRHYGYEPFVSKCNYF